MAAQSADEGGDLPLTVGRRSATTLTVGRRSATTLPTRGTAVASSHVGRSPGFIDKHELFDVHRGQSLAPRPARRDHVRACLLVGVQGFF